MKYLSLQFIIYIWSMMHSEDQIAKRVVWRSDCTDAKIIEMERKDKKLIIKVYGSLIDTTGEKYYYITFGESIKEKENQVAFYLKNYKVSKAEIYKNKKAVFVQKGEFDFEVPNHMNCEINWEKKELYSQITKSSYFSRFDSCTFYMNEEK